MTSCHTSCLTCSSQLFTACLTCSSSLTLSYGTCNCNSAWQTECTIQSKVRQLTMFINMFIQLYIVGIMVLYVLRTKLPLSYRIYSGLGGISLLIYNTIFYLPFQNQFALKGIAVSNGPYFSIYRIATINQYYIFPTVGLLIIMIAMLIVLFFPLQAFNRPYPTIISYIIKEGPAIFDSAYFFVSRMMFFYIGLVIKESTNGVATMYIVVAGLYGLFIVLAWGRCLYQYHQGTLQVFAYDLPIHLYTIMQPANLLGLMMATSTTILVIIYCAPFALLILIVLLNRNMKIISKQNILFFVTEVVMVGCTIAFILLSDPIRNYVLIATIIASALVITLQVYLLYYDGFSLTVSKVHPILDPQSDINQPAAKNKKIFGEQKDGYF